MLQFAGRLRAGPRQSRSWSRQRLVNGFRDDVGLAPKVAARVLRFEVVTSRLRSTAPQSWTELALDAGYFDQAYLAREVRRLAGFSPSELASSLRGRGAGPPPTSPRWRGEEEI